MLTTERSPAEPENQRGGVVAASLGLPEPRHLTKVLIVEDEPAQSRFLCRIFQGRPYQVECAASVAMALEALLRFRPEIILLDYQLPDGTASDVLRCINRGETLPPIIITSSSSIELAVSLVKEGADQFLVKPVDPMALLALCERTLEQAHLHLVARAPAHLEPKPSLNPFYGVSPAIRALETRVRKLLAVSVPVLLYGETGTGKTVLARWIHQQTRRREHAFVEMNCAGLSRELLESELFGHEKGAFTDAASRRAGRFEAADRGTLFLDEVADLSLPAQAKVLRVLQEMRFERLGGEKTISVDVRVIAATNKDIRAEIAAGRFREDLYFRLAVVPIHMPSLREHKEDVPDLCRHFLAKAASSGSPERHISPEGLALLSSRSWPGNVRELANFIERLAVMSDERLVSAQTVQRVLNEGSREKPEPLVAQRYGSLGLAEARELFERDYLVQKLRECDYNVARAADASGIHPSGLHAKIKKHGIEQER